MRESHNSAIEKRAKSRGKGWAFSSKDFVSVAPMEVTHLALHRLHKANKIRRVTQGIYDYPRYSKFLGKTLAPDISQVAHAIARKFGWSIYPSGASALNIIGISTQVPGRYEYLSDGPNKTFSIGADSPIKLTFKHVPTKEGSFKHRESAVLVMALKYLGSENIDENAIKLMRDWLPLSSRKKILKDTQTVTSWVYEAIKKICKEEPNG